MDEMKNVAFVVLNYNDAITTMSLVDVLVKWPKSEIDIHIVIVDNKSSDGSIEKFLERYKDERSVDVISSDYNGGYSYGNNFGVKYAINKYKSQYIAIANPDIEIDYNTFKELLETFDAEKSIAACAPVMKDLEGNYSIHSQFVPSFRDDLQACIDESKVKTVVKHDFTYVNDDKNKIITQMLPGSFFVIRAECLQNVGFFDEGVFLFCEERILGKKLADAGYKQILRSDLFFVHAHSISIKKNYDILKTWKILMTSRQYYQKKYNNITRVQLLLLKLATFYFMSNEYSGVRVPSVRAQETVIPFFKKPPFR